MCLYKIFSGPSISHLFIPFTLFDYPYWRILILKVCTFVVCLCGSKIFVDVGVSIVLLCYVKEGLVVAY